MSTDSDLDTSSAQTPDALAERDTEAIAEQLIISSDDAGSSNSSSPAYQNADRHESLEDLVPPKPNHSSKLKSDLNNLGDVPLSQKPLKFKRLPPVSEIRDAIGKGISHEELPQLASKMGIDASNTSLFNEILEEICESKSFLVLKQESIISGIRIEELEREHARPPRRMRKPAFKDGLVVQELIGETRVTFGGQRELIRLGSKAKPSMLFRYFTEDSKTPSCYVTTYTQVKHRERPDLKLHKDNAFQAVGTFSVHKDVTISRIMRHLTWNKELSPSSWISATGKEDQAKRKVTEHWRNGASKRVRERLSIAVIDVHDLVPITFEVRLEEWEYIWIEGRLVPIAPTERVLEMWGWVNADALSRFHNNSSVTLTEFEETNPEVWLSISELRHCGIKLPIAHSHDHEWLVGGKISKGRIVSVIPFDGEKWHHDLGEDEIRCKRNTTQYRFDKDSLTWVLDQTDPADSGEERRHTSIKDGLQNNRVRSQPEAFTENTMVKIDLSDSEDDSIYTYELGSDSTKQIRKRKRGEGERDDTAKRTRGTQSRFQPSESECNRTCSTCCPPAVKKKLREYAAIWDRFSTNSLKAEPS